MLMKLLEALGTVDYSTPAITGAAVVLAAAVALIVSELKKTKAEVIVTENPSE